MTTFSVGEIGAEEEFVIAGQSCLGCPITFVADGGTTSDLRPKIVDGLVDGLADVNIWPFLPASLPDTPAVVIRRNPYASRAVQGGGQLPSFDAICIVDMAIDERNYDLDALVDAVVPVLEALVV